MSGQIPCHNSRERPLCDGDNNHWFVGARCEGGHNPQPPASSLSKVNYVTKNNVIRPLSGCSPSVQFIIIGITKVIMMIITPCTERGGQAGFCSHPIPRLVIKALEETFWKMEMLNILMIMMMIVMMVMIAMENNIGII